MGVYTGVTLRIPLNCPCVAAMRPVWATVSKTVRLTLSDRCLPVLSVCPVCLSVTLVYCGQTVGRIKMKRTWHAGRSRLWPQCVRWRPSSPSPEEAQPPIFGHICCDQMAVWIKMPLGMKVRLGPGDFVLNGDPAPLPKRGAEPTIFCTCLFRPNGWMYQDASW